MVQIGATPYEASFSKPLDNFTAWEIRAAAATLDLPSSLDDENGS